MKTTKRKLIRVGYVKNIYGTYKPTLSKGMTSFAFVSPSVLEKDGFRTCKQLTDWMRCRELVCTVPNSAIYHGCYVGKNGTEDTGYKFDVNTLRLLIGTVALQQETKEEVKERLFSAKRVINLIEDYAGWEKSTIATVKHIELPDETQTWLLVGSNKWQDVPQILSLLTLILRFGMLHGPFNDTDLDTYVKETVKKAESVDCTDSKYVKLVFPYIKKLINKYDDVFEGDIESNYKDDFLTSASGYGGIYNLFLKESGNVALNKRIAHHVLNKK